MNLTSYNKRSLRSSSVAYNFLPFLLFVGNKLNRQQPWFDYKKRIHKYQQSWLVGSRLKTAPRSTDMQAPNGGLSVVQSWSYDSVSRHSFIRILLQNVRLDRGRSGKKSQESLISIWCMHVIWTPASIRPRWRTLVPYYVSTEPASGIKQIYLDNLECKQQTFLQKSSNGWKVALREERTNTYPALLPFSWFHGTKVQGQHSWARTPEVATPPLATAQL